MIDNFRAIEVESPVDKIIKQIRGLIVAGHLKPGDKLPAERKLSEKLGVGRTYIREALKKLEFLGILHTIPQSGVVINGVDISVMEGFLSNVMKIENPDFHSLVETRVMMERFMVEQACLRRTKEDIIKLEMALDAYEAKVNNGLPAETEDFGFHVKIAEASQNTVIKTMLLIILPDIIRIYKLEKVCGPERNQQTIEEHRQILTAIKKQDVKLAHKWLDKHLHDVVEFSKSKLKAFS